MIKTISQLLNKFISSSNIGVVSGTGSVIMRLGIVTLLTLTIGACNMPGLRGSSPPTADVTQAYKTVQARLTEAASLTPPASPTVSSSDTPSISSPSPSAAPSATARPPATSVPTLSVKLCDQAEAGSPIDVTIPDDTVMSPGHSFTKVWRLRNTGSCSWTRDYSIAVFSGEAFNAPNSVSMPKKIDPGETVDISVDLIAPTSPGTYQGNWKLRNAAGTWFGIGPGGSSPFWVRIVVTGGTGTPVTTIPSEASETATTQASNPPVHVSGSNTMVALDQLNLDTNLLNNGGEDIALVPNANGRLILTALNGAGMIGFGSSMPSYAQCKSAGAGPASVAVRNLPKGYYICHLTDQGLYGWIRIAGFNESSGTLNLQINTWSNP